MVQFQSKYPVIYLRFIGQKGDVDLSQGLHGFGGSGFGQQSKQGVRNS